MKLLSVEEIKLGCTLLSECIRKSPILFLNPILEKTYWLAFYYIFEALTIVFTVK